MDFVENIFRAFARIKKDAQKTTLEHSPALSRKTGAQVYIKWENEQVTGSFKLRGALNKVRSLSSEEKKRGVIAASTGNHAAALAHACSLEGVNLTLVMPGSISPYKMEKLRSYRVALNVYGSSCGKSEQYAREKALRDGCVFISPYNDLEIIYGQGTVGFEIIEELPVFTDVIVPVGGGGLVSGIGGYLKAVVRKTRVKEQVRIWGVEPLNSAHMAASVEAGRIVEIEEKETLCDAVAGGIEEGSVTFPMCRELVDGFIGVEETEVRQAMAALFEHHGKMVEGAGALTLAGLVHDKENFKGRFVVLVVSGGNIAADEFVRIVKP
jgi:threonine dehydratase